MTLANCPAECEHVPPCLSLLYEMADDMAEYGASLPVICHQPVPRDTKEDQE